MKVDSSASKQSAEMAKEAAAKAAEQAAKEQIKQDIAKVTADFIQQKSTSIDGADGTAPNGSVSYGEFSSSMHQHKDMLDAYKSALAGKVGEEKASQVAQKAYEGDPQKGYSWNAMSAQQGLGQTHEFDYNPADNQLSGPNGAAMPAVPGAAGNNLRAQQALAAGDAPSAQRAADAASTAAEAAGEGDKAAHAQAEAAQATANAAWAQEDATDNPDNADYQTKALAAKAEASAAQAQASGLAGDAAAASQFTQQARTFADQAAANASQSGDPSESQQKSIKRAQEAATAAAAVVPSATASAMPGQAQAQPQFALPGTAADPATANPGAQGGVQPAGAASQSFEAITQSANILDNASGGDPDGSIWNRDVQNVVTDEGRLQSLDAGTQSWAREVANAANLPEDQRGAAMTALGMWAVTDEAGNPTGEWGIANDALPAAVQKQNGYALLAQAADTAAPGSGADSLVSPQDIVSVSSRPDVAAVGNSRAWMDAVNRASQITDPAAQAAEYQRLGFWSQTGDGSYTPIMWGAQIQTNAENYNGGSQY